MNLLKIIFVANFLFFFSFAKKLNIIASIPDIKVMTKRIGGNKIKVISLTTGKEDLHAVPVKPSFLPKLNRADLVLSLGLSAEHAWLPALAKESRNSKIMEGNPGWQEISTGIKILSVPKKISKTEGEQHPEGNPHYNINPESGVIMAKNILNVLIENDSKNKSFYQKNFQIYSNELRQTVLELKEKGKALKGIKVIGYHEDINYFCQFYEMEIIGFIEFKHGVPPTPQHLRYITELAKKEKVQLVLCNQAQQQEKIKKFAKNIGAKYEVFYNLVGSNPEINTWQKLQKKNLDIFLKAIKKKK